MSEILNTSNYEELIIDDSLALRALRLDQADELFALTDTNRDYLAHWLPWVDATVSPDDSAEFIAGIRKNRSEGTEYGFGIILDEKVVGHTSLMHVADDREPEIGYWVAESCSGKGVTTKAAQALTGLGFQKLGLSKIIIRADPNNIGSNKVAEKLGYTLERQDPNAVEGIMNIWVKHRDLIK